MVDGSGWNRFYLPHPPAAMSAARIAAHGGTAYTSPAAQTANYNH